MTTPTVTELATSLHAVDRDTFIDGLDSGWPLIAPRTSPALTQPSKGVEYELHRTSPSPTLHRSRHIGRRRRRRGDAGERQPAAPASGPSAPNRSGAQWPALER